MCSSLFKHFSLRLSIHIHGFCREKAENMAFMVFTLCIILSASWLVNPAFRVKLLHPARLRHHKISI